ncbi:MAG: hypothetical protein J2P25_24680 [Nocardiopsaceae bacterium]|nr:hypothetical protein [Nocardiopsaceae bacterium]
MELGRPHTDWDFIVSAQCGVVTCTQARQQGGFSEQQIEYRLEKGRWRRVHRGIYATFTGQMPREARLWAALLWAGKGAMLSHETAAELQELTAKRAWEIHVTVPSRRRPEGKPMRGVVVHRSDQSRCDGVAPWKLPRTQLEDTVLDLVAAASTMDDAYSWLSRAVTRRDPVTIRELREALERRKKFPGRAWLRDALADTEEGAHFPLERRYARDVERAHGLPKATRQARRTIDGKAHRKDTWYEPYGTCVELDGVTYHRDRQHEDRHRDNVNLATDDIRTFRLDIIALTRDACQSAAMIAATLQRNGWKGQPHPCHRPRCPIGKP